MNNMKKVISVTSLKENIKENINENIKENKNITKWVIGGVVITLVVSSMVWMGTRKNAYAVSIDGKVIAVVKTKEEVTAAYEQVVASLKEAVGVDIAVNEQVEIEPIHGKRKEIVGEEALIKALGESISYEIEAYEILVDGQGYAVVSTPEEANTILEEIAKEFLPRKGELTLTQEEVNIESEQKESKDEGLEKEILEKETENTTKNIEIVEVEEALPQEEISNVISVDSFEVAEEKAPEEGQKIQRNVKSFDFNEQVVVRNAYVDKESVLTEEEAKEKLLENRKELIEYALVEGDNIWDIAMTNNTTPERILELNPNIEDETKMQIGEVIKVEKEVPIVTITTVEQSTYKQFIPADIQYVVFSDLYEGETKVYQEGKDGLNEVTVSVTKVNGEEVSRDTINEKVLIKPVIKVIGYGVKQKPVEVKPNDTNNSSHSNQGSSTSSSNNKKPTTSDNKKPTTSSSNSQTSSTGRYSHPLKGEGTISSGYGSRWGSFHKGIDFAAPAGTPIYASDSGKVIYSGYNSGGYGNLVIVQHNNGDQTYYAHCSKLYVSVGTSVSKGQRIAGVGTTGDSTGNHLHFEIRKNGNPVNPSNYL